MPEKKNTRAPGSKRRVVGASKGRQSIPPDFPLSQYGDKAHKAYNAYVLRVGGAANAIEFEEWRTLWDEEHGAYPAARAPKASLQVAEAEAALEAEAHLPVHMMAFEDPTLTYQATYGEEGRESRNDKRLRPQRSFGIFPETDKILRQMATQEKLDADSEGARKNDWLEAALLIMLEDCRRDRPLFERWRNKARHLRDLSREAQWRGIDQER